MESTSNSTCKTLRLISNRLRDLRKKKKQILKLEREFEPENGILTKDQEELLQSKPSVLIRIDLLKKLSNQISSHLHRIKANQSASNEAAPVATGQPHEMTAVPPPFLTFGSYQVPICQSIISVTKLNQPLVLQPATNQEARLNVNDSDTNEMSKLRYLCISDGFQIYCLDLKQSRDHQSNCNVRHVLGLPKISTLKLPEKGLPILMGLFSLGSDAYLVGGREFPALDSEDPQSWFMNIFHSLGKETGLYGTSRDTYRLSLVDGNLCVFKCKSIRPLGEPIAWPIVEKIGDQLHVIESFPADLFEDRIASDPYHGVLNLNDIYGGWVTIRDIRCLSSYYYSREYGGRIHAHLAVGDKIYAQVDNPYKRTFIFHSEKQRWKPPKHPVTQCDGPFLIDNVVQIFEYGSGRSVGGFLSGELGGLFHVVFAMVGHDGINAVAYLVASRTGQILCLQRLHNFFQGVAQPTQVIASAVIEADDEGKTLCSIVEGSTSDELAPRCLFVNTFTVEELSDARLWIRDVWRARSGGQSWAVEQDFVQVVVQDRFVFKMDSQSSLYGDRLQACFL